MSSLALILTACVSLVAVLPPVIDGWLYSKIKSPSWLAFAIAFVGVFLGSIGGALTQLASGAGLQDALTVVAVGAISGLATGFVNYTKAKAQGTSGGQDGGGGTIALAAKRKLANVAAAAVGLFVCATWIGGLSLVTPGCTKGQAESAANAAIQFSIDHCKDAAIELIPPGAPQGVAALVCDALKAGEPAVLVLVDETILNTMKADYTRAHGKLPAGYRTK